LLPPLDTAEVLVFEELPEPLAFLDDLDLATLAELRCRPTEIEDLFALCLAARQNGSYTDLRGHPRRLPRPHPVPAVCLVAVQSLRDVAE